ncbi:unnamed protein product [Ilex paraguariensis]|uniref:Cinnamoyl CoA reductase n=1 Tax=Ilex paraguariensis TaxID=185542 RepID=A0ABC8RIR1_9AQUA
MLSTGIYSYVDVRDVAYAHVQALEIASANGRYCLVETVTYSSETRKILHKLYPTLNIPKKCKNEKLLVPPFQVSKEKAKSLGIDFLPLEVSLRDTVESLKEKKFLNFE